MMNNLFNAIVIVALLGTFLLAPTPHPAPPSVASRPPADSIAVAPYIDGTAARAAIEASGYSAVSELTKAADGTWRAKAYFGNAEVRLVVDGKGKVVAD